MLHWNISQTTLLMHGKLSLSPPLCVCVCVCSCAACLCMWRMKLVWKKPKIISPLMSYVSRQNKHIVPSQSRLKGWHHLCVCVFIYIYMFPYLVYCRSSARSRDSVRWLLLRQNTYKLSEPIHNDTYTVNTQSKQVSDMINQFYSFKKWHTFTLAFICTKFIFTIRSVQFLSNKIQQRPHDKGYSWSYWVWPRNSTSIRV